MTDEAGTERRGFSGIDSHPSPLSGVGSTIVFVFDCVGWTRLAPDGFVRMLRGFTVVSSQPKSLRGAAVTPLGLDRFGSSAIALNDLNIQVRELLNHTLFNNPWTRTSKGVISGSTKSHSGVPRGDKSGLTLRMGVFKTCLSSRERYYSLGKMQDQR